jgi:hypothetical protein
MVCTTSLLDVATQDVTLRAVLFAGGLRVWQYMGEGLAGSILASPGTDTFNETQTKPIVYVVTHPMSESPLYTPYSSDISSA